MKPEILLLGGGGHCRSCIDVIESCGEYSISGVVDNVRTGTVLGYRVLGTDSDLEVLLQQTPNALVTVGQIKEYEARLRLFNKLKQLRATIPRIFSVNAHVSKNAYVDEGCVVMHGAIINAGAYVASNCIVNSQALIEHDVQVGANCHISTGVKVNGGVTIGDCTFVGSGAIVREGVRIGARVIIGAGAVILNDISNGCIIKGRPSSV